MLWNMRGFGRFACSNIHSGICAAAVALHVPGYAPEHALLWRLGVFQDML